MSLQGFRIKQFLGEILLRARFGGENLNHQLGEEGVSVLHVLNRWCDVIEIKI